MNLEGETIKEFCTKSTKQYLIPLSLDVIVLCPQSSKDQVRMQVEKYEESSDLRMEVSVRDVPAGVDGTAQALRSIASLIKVGS